MSAQIGSKARLAEVRAAAAKRRARGLANERAAWQIIDRCDAAEAVQTVLEAYPDRLRALTVAGLAHEADRLDQLAQSAVVVEMRTEIELERAGRQWQHTVRLAAEVGWESVMNLQRGGVPVGAA